MQSEQQQRIMGYFIEEAKDHLNTIEQGLLNLQSTIADPEMVSEVFRAAHSVKGGAAMLGLSSIQHTAHRLEDYFKVLKECPIRVDQKIETLFLRIFDALQELLEQLQGPFGLSDDKAEEVMADVEPVFHELGSHLNTLVAQSGGLVPDEVQLVTPPVAATPAAQPQPIAQEESALLLIFKSDVPVRLREMLQLFKQPEGDVSRGQLQDICQSLVQAGEQFELSNWVTLIDMARRAIACNENAYRTLAPIVIKEIKQAQELVLGGRSTEIWCSEGLQALVPATPSVAIDDDLAGLLAAVDFGDDSDSQEFIELDLDTEPDLFNTSYASGDESPLNETDWMSGLTTPSNAFESDNNLNFGLGSGLFDAAGSEAASLHRSASSERHGPEVGAAELNSLADLFEGEVLDLGLSWQEEEEVTDTDNELTPEPFPAPSEDLSDLFTDSTNLEELEELDLDPNFSDDDLSELLNAAEQAIAPLASDDEGLAFDLSSVATNDADDSDDWLTATHPSTSSNVPAVEEPGGFDNLGDIFAALDESAFDEADFLLESDLDSNHDPSDHSDHDDTSGHTESNANPFNPIELDSIAIDSIAPVEPPELLLSLDTNDDDLIASLLDEPEPLDGSIADPWAALDLEDGMAVPGSEAPIAFPAAESDQPLGEDLLGEDLWGNDQWGDRSSGGEPDPSVAAIADPPVGNEEEFDWFGASEDEDPFGALELNDLNLDLPQSLETDVPLDESTAGLEEGNDLLDDLFAPTEDVLVLEEVAPSPNEPALLQDNDLFFNELEPADSPPTELGAIADATASPSLEAELGDGWTLLDDGTDSDFLFQSEDFNLNLEATSEDSLDFSALDSTLDREDSLDFSALDSALNEEPAIATSEELGFGATDDLGFDLADALASAEDGNLELESDEEAIGGERSAFSELDDLLGEDIALTSDITGTAGDSISAMAELDSLLDSNPLDSNPLDSNPTLSITDAAAPEDDAFADLDSLLAGTPLSDLEPEPEEPQDVQQPQDLQEPLPASNGFADLDALLAPEPPAFIPEASNDFADLDALLADEPVPADPISSIPVSAIGGDDFDDLEKLLEDADQTLGGTPTNRGVRSPVAAAARTKLRPSRGGMTEQTMRVSVKNLDNLNNLVGELVVNRNSLEQAQERLRQFLDNLLYQVQQLGDVGQRMRDLYERSLLESSLLSSRRSYQLAGNTGYTDTQSSHATGVSFDALEMDRFTGFHTLSQEMIELIVRVRESASDIDFVVDETDQVTRNFRQITTQLQEGLTRSRMVPFAQTADRLPRAVRDISLKCGKQAELAIEGRETLIDKMILEQLYDPMTHLVNNAITHGIETPTERSAAGKPPTGRITIRTFHQGNQTVISVTDDGAGIDPEKVKRKAVEKGLITRAEAEAMSRLDVYDLLFHHGFSTRDKADDFAGRGVGMDVVRTSLNEIRGVVNIDSAVGRGTTFTIRLPLTLSISKALCCISNRARIAFPMDGVEDMLDIPQERIQHDDQGRPCIQWRDQILPFQPLSELLRYNRSLGRGSVYGGNQEDDIISVVVLRSNAGNFLALQVDQVLGEQEIVIKQLEGPVPKPIGVAGATVLGDGRIMPIADVLELIDLSLGRIRREAGGSLWEKGEEPPTEATETKTEPTVLIVDDSITVRELLSMTFSKIGYRVEQARDGQEAWEKLRSGLPCDLVFCDIEMPRMDGLELLSRIQKDVSLNHLPIAMLTSRGADRHRQMAIQLGAKGYFTKPYLEEALLDAAQRMLKGEVLVHQSS